MRSKTLSFKHGWRLAPSNARAQVAEMVLAPGEREGGPGNSHRSADQWLFVVDGQGVATIEGRRRALRPGSLLLIEHGECHEIRNTGTQLLRTLDFYVPPAYGRRGKALKAGRPARRRGVP